MRQYLDVKARYPDAIVFFRLGRLLRDVLRGRGLRRARPRPHADDARQGEGRPGPDVRRSRTTRCAPYLAKLTELGHRVALCEQLEDPRAVRGIVKRDVVRVVTPGVMLDEESLDPRAPSYVAAVVGRRARRLRARVPRRHDRRLPRHRGGDRRRAGRGDRPGRAARAGARARRRRPGARRAGAGRASATVPRATVATGDDGGRAARARSAPAFAARPRATGRRARRRPRPRCCATRARTQPGVELPLTRLDLYARDRHAGHRRAGAPPPRADRVAARSPARRARCIDVLDESRDRDGRAPAAALAAVSVGRRRAHPPPPRRRRAAGRRATRRATRPAACWARSPTSSGWSGGRGSAWRRRAISPVLGRSLAAAARAGRRARGRATPASSAARVAGEREPAAGCGDDLGRRRSRPELARVLRADAPARDQGRRLRQRRASRPSSTSCATSPRAAASRIAAIEARERERTGIPSLKVKFNSVFGYYIEVTRAHLASVPADYRRKQTVANAERFVTPELAEFEQTDPLGRRAPRSRSSWRSSPRCARTVGGGAPSGCSRSAGARRRRRRAGGARRGRAPQRLLPPRRRRRRRHRSRRRAPPGGRAAGGRRRASSPTTSASTRPPSRS